MCWLQLTTRVIQSIRDWGLKAFFSEVQNKMLLWKSFEEVVFKFKIYVLSRNITQLYLEKHFTRRNRNAKQALINATCNLETYK